MRNFIILTEAINFIELNLCEPITRGDIAKNCCVSLSSLEKLFRYALHISIKEYVERRKMTLAAKDIAHGLSVTEAALKYQYNSPEVFTRSFHRVWNVNPSEFTGKWNFTDLFPKINYDHTEGINGIMPHRKVDISEAYDYLYERRGSYVLCLDGKHFSEFNKIAYKAGDLAILEIAARIDRAAAGDMMLMRIGGDEFALVTGLYDKAAAQAIMDEILSHNGEPIEFEGKPYPLSMWCAMTVVPDSIRYNELFAMLHQTISDSKL